jgi:type IV pilus assembly protein PilB
MTDVDAIRWMASEHDLEFVDLDTYGVDPAAGDILPASLSRQHHVVAIKRKFGTPVIATADPDDTSALETVRSSIGRDFISVVASREQISAYLDQLYASEDGAEESAQFEAVEEPAQVDLAEEPAQVDLAEEPAQVDLAEEPAQVDLAEEPAQVDLAEEPAQVDLVDGEKLNGLADTGDDLAEISVAVDDAGLNGVGRSDDPEIGEAPGEPESPTRGKRSRKDSGKPRARKSASKAVDADSVADADSAVDSDSDAPALGDAEDESKIAEPLELLDEGIPDVAIGPDTGESELFGGPSVGLDLSFPLPPEPTAEAEPVQTGDGTSGLSETLEPATSLLPEFESNATTPDLKASSDALESSADQLAELALTVQDDASQSGSSTDLAADLVAEAVATFQEQQGDEQWNDAIESDPASVIALFPPLAKALVDGERVSLEDIELVLDEHYRTGQSVARILTARKLVTEADLMWGMAQEMGLDFVDLDAVGVDFGEAGTIPEATARHHNVMVIANDDGTPVVAASNPTDVFAMDDLRTIMGRNFIVVVATRTQISSYIGQAFNSGGDAADMAMEASLGFDGTAPEKGVDDIQAVTEEAPIVRYVNLLILQALNERASDVHVEPTATDLRIRYRIDGVLHDVSTAPRAISAAVTTRLKVMADMNVAEHRIPQDGRISLNVGSKGIDLRMATLPTIHGEKVVMRVLDKSSVVLGFADLGFDEDLLTTYETIYTKPYGTILVTGPTGSGKSTTLYTTLTALNSTEKNIITVEDPVELQLKGVNQVQLNVKAGLTFASALKSILRSDPDIVLVGEIRDKETAVIAIEAALTGHMVLSTLHTNSAASTPMRLIEMGIEPFLVTSSLSGVLAQRLTRRLCMHCKEPYEPTEADIAAAGWTLEEVNAVGTMSKVFRSVGCSACANTGYRGRKALSELMPMTEEIERLIIEGGSVEDIHKLAVAQGMLTLRQSGIRKAIEGETTLEEVLRVVA